MKNLFKLTFSLAAIFSSTPSYAISDQAKGAVVGGAGACAVAGAAGYMTGALMTKGPNGGKIGAAIFCGAAVGGGAYSGAVLADDGPTPGHTDLSNDPEQEELQ